MALGNVAQSGLSTAALVRLISSKQVKLWLSETWHRFWSSNHLQQSLDSFLVSRGSYGSRKLGTDSGLPTTYSTR